MERRSFIKGAAWSVPVIAVAVASPLAAASQPPRALQKRLRFNTARAFDLNPWDAAAGSNKPRIGVVVAAMDTAGPDAIGPVVLMATICDSAGRQHTQSTTRVIGRGWGATPDHTFTFDGVARGAYRITLTATANGCEVITTQLNERTVS